MNAAVIEPRAWSPARRWGWIALVFAMQVGLILALGSRKPAPPRPPAPAPSLNLVPDSSEWLALNDPTLFALPHRQGFAGAAWLNIFTNEVPPFRWTEPPRLLRLPVADLGVTFAQFMRTNVFASRQFEAKPVPDLPLPVAEELVVTAVTNSTVHLAGDLVNRHLLNPPQLPTWPALDLLTNSVVQVLVNAGGNVMSHTLLPPGSGVPNADQRAADQRALELARAARFEPLRRTAPALTIGALIFEWHSELLTNAPAAQP